VNPRWSIGPTQALLIVRQPDGSGMLLNLGDHMTMSVQPIIYEPDVIYDYGGFQVYETPRVVGFDVEAHCPGATMLWCANFEDLFRYARSNATEQPGLPPHISEIGQIP
jgi:hypothetical protein